MLYPSRVFTNIDRNITVLPVNATPYHSTTRVPCLPQNNSNPILFVSDIPLQPRMGIYYFEVTVENCVSYPFANDDGGVNSNSIVYEDNHNENPTSSGTGRAPATTNTTTATTATTNTTTATTASASAAAVGERSGSVSSPVESNPDEPELSLTIPPLGGSLTSDDQFYIHLFLRRNNRRPFRGSSATSYSSPTTGASSPAKSPFPVVIGLAADRPRLMSNAKLPGLLSDSLGYFYHQNMIYRGCSRPPATGSSPVGGGSSPLSEIRRDIEDDAEPYGNNATPALSEGSGGSATGTGATGILKSSSSSTLAGTTKDLKGADRTNGRGGDSTAKAIGCLVNFHDSTVQFTSDHVLLPPAAYLGYNRGATAPVFIPPRWLRHYPVKHQPTSSLNNSNEGLAIHGYDIDPIDRGAGEDASSSGYRIFPVIAIPRKNTQKFSIRITFQGPHLLFVQRPLTAVKGTEGGYNKGGYNNPSNNEDTTAAYEASSDFPADTVVGNDPRSLFLFDILGYCDRQGEEIAKSLIKLYKANLLHSRLLSSNKNYQRCINKKINSNRLIGEDLIDQYEDNVESDDDFGAAIDHELSSNISTNYGNIPQNFLSLIKRHFAARGYSNVVNVLSREQKELEFVGNSVYNKPIFDETSSNINDTFVSNKSKETIFSTTHSSNYFNKKADIFCSTTEQSSFIPIFDKEKQEKSHLPNALNSLKLEKEKHSPSSNEIRTVMKPLITPNKEDFIEDINIKHCSKDINGIGGENNLFRSFGYNNRESISNNLHSHEIKNKNNNNITNHNDSVKSVASVMQKVKHHLVVLGKPLEALQIFRKELKMLYVDDTYNNNCDSANDSLLKCNNDDLSDKFSNLFPKTVLRPNLGPCQWGGIILKTRADILYIFVLLHIAEEIVNNKFLSSTHSNKNAQNFQTNGSKEFEKKTIHNYSSSSIGNRDYNAFLASQYALISLRLLNQFDNINKANELLTKQENVVAMAACDNQHLTSTSASIDASKTISKNDNFDINSNSNNNFFGNNGELNSKASLNILETKATSFTMKPSDYSSIKNFCLYIKLLSEIEQELRFPAVGEKITPSSSSFPSMPTKISFRAYTLYNHLMQVIAKEAVPDFVPAPSHKARLRAVYALSNLVDIINNSDFDAQNNSKDFKTFSNASFFDINSNSIANSNSFNMNERNPFNREVQSAFLPSSSGLSDEIKSQKGVNDPLYAINNDTSSINNICSDVGSINSGEKHLQNQLGYYGSGMPHIPSPSSPHNSLYSGSINEGPGNTQSTPILLESDSEDGIKNKNIDVNCPINRIENTDNSGNKSSELRSSAYSEQNPSQSQRFQGKMSNLTPGNQWQKHQSLSFNLKKLKESLSSARYVAWLILVRAVEDFFDDFAAQRSMWERQLLNIKASVDSSPSASASFDSYSNNKSSPYSKTRKDKIVDIKGGYFCSGYCADNKGKRGINSTELEEGTSCPFSLFGMWKQLQCCTAMNIQCGKQISATRKMAKIVLSGRNKSINASFKPTRKILNGNKKNNTKDKHFRSENSLTTGGSGKETSEKIKNRNKRNLDDENYVDEELEEEEEEDEEEDDSDDELYNLDNSSIYKTRTKRMSSGSIQRSNDNELNTMFSKDSLNSMALIPLMNHPNRCCGVNNKAALYYLIKNYEGSYNSKNDSNFRLQHRWLLNAKISLSNDNDAFVPSKIDIASDMLLKCLRDALSTAFVFAIPQK